MTAVEGAQPLLTTDTLLAVPAALERLRGTPPPATGVLSVYLDVSPSRVAGHGYLLALRDACKAIRPALPEAERVPFEAAVANVERYLAKHQVGGPGHGLALFASSDASYFFVAHLPQPVADDVSWAPRPELEPLEATLDDFERVAVVVFDKERARLFTLFLGAVEERREFHDYAPRRHSSGFKFAPAQTRIARRREHYLQRHADHVIRALAALLRERPFERLFLAGPDEAVAVLRHRLPRPLRARLVGTLSVEAFAPDETILREALAAAAAAEQQDEVKQVDALIEAAAQPHVALGLAATLAAISEERVHRLLLADTFDALGDRCPSCGRLVPGRDACPSCGTAATPLPSLREQLLDRAWEQDARVEIVSGAAASRLMTLGGLGAWTRY